MGTSHDHGLPAGVDTDSLAVGDVIRATERERLRSLVEADMAIAAELHADEFQLVTPGGGTLSKKEYLGGIASEDINYLVFEPAAEIDVRSYGTAAAIRYRSNLRIIFDGHDSGMGIYWHTDLYEFHDGRWQAVWSQATRIT